jgi:hypothetical protein
MAFLAGGCAAALDETAERDDQSELGQPGGEAGAQQLAFSDAVAMCEHTGNGFVDIVVDASAVAAHLAAGDVLGDCSQFFCGGS